MRWCSANCTIAAEASRVTVCNGGIDIPSHSHPDGKSWGMPAGYARRQSHPCPGSSNVFLGEALPTNRSPRESYRGVILTRGRGKLCEVEVVCVQPLRYNRTREWSPADTKGRSYNCGLRPHVSLGTENDSIKRITNYRTTGPR